MLIPHGYPAVSCMKVFQLLEASAIKTKVPYSTGMSLSSDLFYKSELVPSTLEMYSKGNVAIVEMEISALFVIGYMNKIQTGALCIVDGSPLEWSEGNYDPDGVKMKSAKKNMLTVAIDTCAQLAAQQHQ
eukprot:GHVS01010783.1.p1 GENE.GHVS01010783.1~~GHVS01010783.1.p1  ORF type:complete len:130 (+),score=22.26 GHVS01010783.1:450-839(+)